MSHSHHSHNHSHGEGNIRLAFFLNLGFTIIEIIGGILTNSIAIISDAIHDLGDSLSLGLAWYLDSKSKQKANHTFSFGYARFSLLGALINSIVLIVGSIFVIYEATQRIIHPEISNADGMIVFALFGIIINGYAAWKVSGGKTLNEKVISWHLMEDVLGWVAVLIAGIALKFYTLPYLDPILSLLIVSYILWGVIGRLKETLYIFLQGVPKEIDLEKIKIDLKNIPSVDSLHHTHIWSLESQSHIFTSHIRLRDINTLTELFDTKKTIKQYLQQYQFKHSTLEIELDPSTCSLSYSKK